MNPLIGLAFCVGVLIGLVFTYLLFQKEINAYDERYIYKKRG